MTGNKKRVGEDARLIWSCMKRCRDAFRRSLQNGPGTQVNQTAVELRCPWAVMVWSAVSDAPRVETLAGGGRMVSGTYR